MACPAVTTSRGFLSETLAHLDCQAQTIGSFGFQTLAAPGSVAGNVLLALLTLFIALFGLRLLFGEPVGARDLIGGALKVGIVLTLSLSWPAYRILAYNTVLLGPGEITAQLGSDNLPDLRSGLAERLQGIDAAMVRLSALGTGRQTGSLERPGDTPDSFTGVALHDESGFAWARVTYLSATIGSLALLRIAGGLLLALAPLFAGLLLFDMARGLFAGWLRGLALVALGSVGLALTLAVQVALMEPWLADALNRRQLGYATPAAPTEMLALAIGFALANFGLIALLARVAFQNAWPMTARRSHAGERNGPQYDASAQANASGSVRILSQAALPAGEAMAMRLERETVRAAAPPGSSPALQLTDARASAPGRTRATNALGSSYRRTLQRGSRAQARRDAQG